MSYLVRIGSTGNVLRIINPNLSVTSTVSGTDTGVSWYLGGQNLKFQDIPPSIIAPSPATFLTVLSSGQVSVNNTPSVLDPYKFSVLGDSSLTGNIYIDGTISAKSLFFTSTTALALSITGEALNILGSVSITGDNITPLKSNMLEVYSGGTNSFPKFFVSSAGNSSVSGNLGITGNLSFPDRVRGSTTSGVIFLGPNRFIHSFHPVSGGFYQNIFIGQNAGNFTTSGQLAYEAGGNIAIGQSSLAVVRSAYGCVAIGLESQILNTSGAGNVSVGSNTLTKITTAANNLALGGGAGQHTTGQYNVLVGAAAGQGVAGSSMFSQNVYIGFQCGYLTTTGQNNLSIGYQSLLNNVLGSNNLSLGYQSSSSLTSGNRNIVIGAGIITTSATSSDELNIANTIYGKLSNTRSVGIGVNPNLISAKLHLTAGRASASSAPLKLMAGELLTTSESGALEFTSQNFYKTENSLARTSIPGVLFSQTASVTANGANANDQTLTGNGVGTLTLPINFFSSGKTIRFTARGFRSIIHDCSLNHKITLISSLNSTTFLETGDQSVLTGLDKYWETTGLITCVLTGNLGTFWCQGHSLLNHSYSSSNHSAMINTIPITASTTGTLQIAFTNTLKGSTDSTDKCVCTNLIVEVLN